MSVVGRVLDVLRSRMLSIDLPGVAMATLLVTTILAGCLTGAPDVETPTTPGMEDRLPAELLGALLDGADASRLLQPGKDGVPQMPGDLADLMGRVLPSGVERLPLPEPPAEAPLAAALSAFALHHGKPAPSAEILDPAISALRLDAEAETALAMLVLSYLQALDLQRQATQDLLPSEVALLQQVAPTDPDAVAAAVAKIDRDRMMQGADLLARAAEAARGPLANPPVPATQTATGAPVAPASSPQTAPTARPPTDWSGLEAIMQTLDGDGAPATPTSVPSLAEAMEGLAAAYGAPVPAVLPDLPASLDHAVATIVHAQATAARSTDSAASARALFAAARDAEPALRAWGAWLAPLETPGDVPGPDLAAFLTETLAPTPGPAALVAAGRGHAPPEPLTPRSLSDLLSFDMDATTAAAVEAALGPQVSEALAQILAAALHVQSAYDEAMQNLPPQQQRAIQNLGSIQDLLDEPTLDDSEAAAVEALALALTALSVSGDLEAIQAAQETALATVERAVRDLTVALPSIQTPTGHDQDPLPHTPGTPSTDDRLTPTPVCVDFPASLSRCGEDVLFRAVVGGHLVIVTGFGSTDLNSIGIGDPDIHIDLGGDDTYRATVGVARTDRSPGDNPLDLLAEGDSGGTPLALDFLNAQSQQPVASVSVDLSGDDVYLNNGPLAQGVGSGIGALGILWDVSGDDRYEHQSSALVAYGQGTGVMGGIGVLVDSGGDDEYEATGETVYAQGVGLQGSAFVGNDADITNPSLRPTGAVGMLLDLGSGADIFLSDGGQGHSAGPGNTGLLLDQEGTTTYTVTNRSPYWQGGRAGADGLLMNQVGGNRGGLGALIDLGGAGDKYVGAGNLPMDVAFFPDGEEPRRQDDSMWTNRTGALGLDSSLRDEDGDTWPSLMELLAGSDPHNSDDRPSAPAPDGWIAQIVALIEGGPESLLKDTDGDGFPDQVELVAETDPDDPTSTPPDTVPLSSIADRSLCPVDEPCDFADPSNSIPSVCSQSGRREPCVSLLSLGLAGRDVHDHPAIVRIDLAGNDEYTHQVAGVVRVQGLFGLNMSTGSIHVDLGGDDQYLTPERDETQGSAPADRVSILLDLDGDDQYMASSRSQGHGEGFGFGLMADLAGNDTYTFFTQGRGVGNGTGLTFDAGGQDIYHSIDAVNHTASLEAIANAGDEVFSSQGGGAENGTGLFVDSGDDWDLYWVPLTDEKTADASFAKNNVLVHRKDGGGFADGREAAVRDYDEDGGVGLLESVFGTHPGNGDDNRSFYKGPENALEDGRPVLDSLWLLGVPGLIIGGRGDSIYTESAPILIDLGGNDTYLAPTLASANQGVALLLDVYPEGGSGDDSYQSTCSSKTQNLITCPSLGSANAGIAILADAGGMNAFHTRVSLDRSFGIDTEEASVEIMAHSQGVGTVGGVGILSIWNGTNDFRVDVVANITQANTDASITLDLAGIAQGSGSVQGIGILANFGNQSDSYSINLETNLINFNGIVSEKSLGQGATVAAGETPMPPEYNQTNPNLFGLPNTGFSRNYVDCIFRYLGLGSVSPTAATPCWHSPSPLTVEGITAVQAPLGIIVDRGGVNFFHATGAEAQGSGTGGVLWSGEGDDLYLAGPRSQAQGGLLVDLGGNDQYRIRAPNLLELATAPVCTEPCVSFPRANAQAAASGLLLDLQGDDVHDATGWTHTQGVSGGALLDLGGSDAYRAGDFSQGHEGILMDLTGRDHYRLDYGEGSQGQGFGANALFIDAGGHDLYEGTSSPGGVVNNGAAPPEIDGGRRTDNNGWTEGGGYGVDTSHLGASLAAVSAMLVGEVVLSVRTGSDVTNAADSDLQNGVRGTVHLFATLHEVRGTVDRVAFLLDNDVIGYGTPVNDEEDTYHFEWNTQAPAAPTPDGFYTLVAAAFPSMGGDAVVDLPAKHSSEKTIGIDNPPALATFLSPHAFSPSQEGTRALLDINLSVDISYPGQLEKDNANGRSPGAFVKVDGENLQTGTHFDVVSESYFYSGNTQVEICSTGCPDGRYNLTIVATDSSLQNDTTNEELLVDTQAPVTTISTLAGDGYANARDNSGNNLVLQLARDDDLGKLGVNNVSGVSKTLLVKLPNKETDPPLYTRLIKNPDLTSVTIPIKQGESSIRLVAVSTDAVGNEESPCMEGEPRYISQQKIDDDGLCYRSEDAVELFLDFGRPSLFEPTVNLTHVRPGQPVSFRVQAVDIGSGINTVSVQILDESPVLMNHVGNGLFVFDQWGTYNAELRDSDELPVYAGKEQEYFFTITAIDKAGNDRSIATSGKVIDDRAPRVEVLPTRYTSADGNSLPQGSPGSEAMFVARITDFNLNSLASMEVVGLPDILGEDVDPVPCKPGVDSDFSLWGCEFLLVDSFPDGAFDVRVRVVDLAGNINDTATLPLVVDSEPAIISDLSVIEIAHDRFTLGWKTSVPTTSQVRYGQTPSVSRGTEPPTEYATEHSVEVQELAPSTEYFFQAVSVSRSGVIARSAVDASSVVKTKNAFTVTIAELEGGETLHGSMNLNLDVTLLSGTEAVDIQVSIQDATGETTPRPLAQALSDAAVTIPIETRTIPDGWYRFVVDASRGTDRMTLQSPPFSVDNTPPAISPMSPLAGATLTDTTPDLRLAVVDAAGGLSDAAVLVGGVPVESTWSVEEDFSVQGGIIVITVLNELQDGLHEVEVSVIDLAGNEGSTRWNFRIDTLPPQSSDARVFRYDPGPTAGQPGATAYVEANFTDVSGVADVFVDLGPLGGSNVPLLPTVQNLWIGSFEIPADAPPGLHDLPFVGADHAGNRGAIGTVRVVVDQTAPRILDAIATAPNATAISVRINVDEPATIRVVVEGRTFTSSDLKMGHTLNVTGLRPGTYYSIAIEATDGAGNHASTFTNQRTGPDLGPPTVPGQVRADPREEGVVTLSWQAATDDAGIDHYLVTRTIDNKTVELSPVFGNNLSLRDILPRPVPEAATYELWAVDLAGKSGISANVVTPILSLPHIKAASLSPERGTTDDPFLAEVFYWSPNGQPADRVELVLGDHHFPLAFEDNGTDCLESCRYAAEVSLPATRFQVTDPPEFVAESNGNTVGVSLGWVPVVLSGTDGPAVRGELEAPGPAPLTFLFLLLATLAMLRTRRRRL